MKKLLVFAFLIFILMDVYSQRAVQIQELKNNLRSPEENAKIYLRDSTGIYDKNLELYYTKNGNTILYSKVLKYGLPVNYDSEIERFLSYTRVPNPFGDDLIGFTSTNLNLSAFENKLRRILDDTTISFSEEDRLDSLIRMRHNDIESSKEVFMLPLLVYIGEKIRRRKMGNWTVMIDTTFLCHKVGIKDGRGNIYYPYYIANKFFEDKIYDVEFLIELYTQQ